MLKWRGGWYFSHRPAPAQHQFTFNRYLNIVNVSGPAGHFKVVSLSMWLPANTNETGYCDDSMAPQAEAWNGLLCVETVIRGTCTLVAWFVSYRVWV